MGVRIIFNLQFSIFNEWFNALMIKRNAAYLFENWSLAIQCPPEAGPSFGGKIGN